MTTSLANKLHLLRLKIWCTEEISADLRNANIMTIFKKGDRVNSGNYGDTALLSISGKILTRI